MTGTGAVPDSAAQTDLVVGLLASPGPAAELTAGLVAEVADRLAAHLPGAQWKVEFVIDRLVAGDRAALQQTLLRDLCDTMLNGSLCALGGLTPYPVLSALDYFSEDFSKPAALQAAKR